MSAVLSLDADEIPGASDQSAPQLITLISKEGHRMQVARQALMASELCKTTLEGGQPKQPSTLMLAAYEAISLCCTCADDDSSGLFSVRLQLEWPLAPSSLLLLVHGAVHARGCRQGCE